MARRFLRKVGDIEPIKEYEAGRFGDEHLAARGDVEIIDEFQLPSPAGCLPGGVPTSRRPRVDLTTDMDQVRLGPAVDPAIAEAETDSVARIPAILRNRHLARTAAYIPPQGAIPENLGR